MDYSEKLKSPKWQKKRLEVLNRDSFTCCSCKDDNTELHVHHLKYTGEPYDAPLDDLQTLCKDCHYYFTFLHDKLIKNYSLTLNDFIKITKIENSLISEFKTKTFVLLINENKIIPHGVFTRNSKIIDELYKISKTIL